MSSIIQNPNRASYSTNGLQSNLIAIYVPKGYKVDMPTLDLLWEHDVDAVEIVDAPEFFDFPDVELSGRLEARDDLAVLVHLIAESAVQKKGE